MHKFNVGPPEIAFTRLIVKILVKTLLSQVFEDDISSLDFVIAGFDCTIFTFPKAIVVQITLLAKRTSPKDKVGSEHHLFAHFLVSVCKFYYEVESLVI